MNNLLTLPKRGSYKSLVNVESVGVMFCAFAFLLSIGYNSAVLMADGFTDIFYTSSFRGSFEWFAHFNWLGTVVQAVISIFSLVGVCLIVIRIMTSLLYLSAKGLWEEVHELKQSGGGGEKDLFGLGGMLKTWASGKSGTGLDALFGAILILLPDVIEYSDFGSKSNANGRYDKEMTVTQYILKAALPTVMSVFFFAMGFNGTLTQGLAVTVDAMGSVADQAVSVNYAGFVEDLIAKGTGYKFVFGMEGTEQGDLKNGIALNMYAKVVTSVKGVTPAQQQEIGKNIEDYVNGENGFTAWMAAAKVSNDLAGKLTAGEDGTVDDHYYSYLGYDVYMTTSSSAGGVAMSTFYPSDVVAGEQEYYLVVQIRQSSTYSGGARVNNAFTNPSNDETE